MASWLTIYECPFDRRNGVKVGDIVSANDGDVCIAAAMEEICSRVNPFCIDIGADEGWWSLFIRQYSPLAEVIAFEPNPLNYEKLVKNTEGKGIQCIQKGVSERDCMLQFSLEGGCSNSREGTVSLPCTRIDSYLEGRENIIIKIDTEGHDIIILKTLLPYLKQIHTIVFEFSIYWYNNKEEAVKILEILRKFFNHMYMVSRRGKPVLRDLSKIDLTSFTEELDIYHHQIDILVTREPMKTIPII